jgi:arylsulfatase
MADDMGYSDLGCMGSEIPTPNLDRLASKGLLMSQFYNAGRCCPSRASLLTGLYPHQAGLGDMDSDKGFPSYQGQLKSNTVTLAEMLKKAGYDTGISGKWHVGNAPEVQPLRRGFDEQFLIKGGGGLYFYPPRINRSLLLNEEVFVPDSTTFYSTDAINDYAVRFVERHQQRPYFLYVAHVAPHFPLQAKAADIEKFRGKYLSGYEVLQRERFNKMKQKGLVHQNAQLPQNSLKMRWEELSTAEKDSFDLAMATYAAQITCMDEGIGRIIKKLEETGQLENTLVLFLSDNGGEATHVKPVKGASARPGDRYNWTSYGQEWATVSNTPYRKYKMYVHEGGIRTPLIVHYPMLLPKGRVEEQPAHIMDIFPTLMQLANSTYPATAATGEPTLPLEGKTLVPTWIGKPQVHTVELGWEHEGNRAYRIGHWKLVATSKVKQWELYNLKNDPFESQDLSSKYSKKTQQLIRKYNQWANRVGVVELNQFSKNK